MMAHYQERNNDPDFPSAQDSTLHRWECDSPSCNRAYSGEGTFSEVWKEAREHGWRCIQIRDRWVHYCPDHSERIR